jgi:hypothetical protein
MNNKYNNIIRVFPEIEASKECNYFCISSKDRLRRVVTVVGSKQVFFDRRNVFPVLKSCRILRRTDNNNNTSPIDTDSNISKRNMDQIDQMIDSDPDLPSTLQGNNDESTLIATAKDDDDVTVQTSNSTKPKQAWKSYNIKLLLTINKTHLIVHFNMLC